MSGINIKIDLSTISSPVKINNDKTIELQESILWESSSAFIYNWREEANNNLHSTRSLYKRSITEPKINQNFSIIELVGVLPNMIEDGASAFDMKEAFAKSAKVIKKKNGGWFLTIPFRWSTGNAIGDNEAFSNKMPLGVYETAKELEQTEETGDGSKLVYGESLNKADLPKQFQGYGIRKAIKGEDNKIIYGSYKHKSNLYEGMIKINKDYENTNQNKYMTFRRVSDLSDPLAFIHPGFTARHFAEKAINDTDFDFIVQQAVNNFVNGIL